MRYQKSYGCDSLLLELRYCRRFRKGRRDNLLNKTIKIGWGDNSYTEVNAYFLDRLIERYGNVSFREAMNKYINGEK